MAMYALMLDPARLIFRHEWYFRRLPDWARWGYTTLVLNLMDDSGCAMALYRHPELVSPNAFSQDTLRRLSRHAEKHGITLVPLVSSLGHTGYIHQRRVWRHLRDHDGGRAVVCPAHPDTRGILSDILDEVLEIFPSKWVHVGLDETGPLPKAHCARCRAAFGENAEAKPFIEHLHWLHGQLSAAGRELMMWGDFFLSHPAMLEQAPHDILICDWHYQADVRPETVRFFTRRGFRVVGTSALSCSPGTTILPNAYNLANLAGFARVVSGFPQGRVTGLMNTVWQHTYTLFGVMEYGIAYAAHHFRNPHTDETRFSEAFARAFFASEDVRGLGRLLRDVHAAAPLFQAGEGNDTTFYAKRMIALLDETSVNTLSADEAEALLDMHTRADDIVTGLRAARRSIHRNRRYFDAYLLAAEIMRHIGRRAQVLIEVSRLTAAARAADDGREARRLRRTVRDRIRRLARESRALTDRAWANFDWGSYADSPMRNAVYLAPADDRNRAEQLVEMNLSNQCMLYSGTNRHIQAALRESTRWLEGLACRAESWVRGQGDFPHFDAIPLPRPPPEPVTEFVRRWRISPVFPMPPDFAALPPAHEETKRWEARDFGPQGCDLRLDPFADAAGSGFVYLNSAFSCPEPMKLELGLGYDGPVKVWLDDAEVFCDPDGTNPMGTDKARIPWSAPAGMHEVTVAVSGNEGRAHGFRLRFRRMDIAASVRPDAPSRMVLPSISASSWRWTR